MLGTVILIEGWDPVAGAAMSLRAGSHDTAAVCHLNGTTWWPAIAKLPTLRYDLFDGAFAGQITAPSSTLTLRTEPWPSFGRYQLADARFRLWTGEVGAAWADWTLRFDGRVTAQPVTADGSAEVAFAVDDRWLDTAILSTYAGTTGAEGPAALKGQVKPLSLGAPRYVSGTLVDSVNSVFQVSAFAINAVEVALERLARFGPPVGDYPTYAALVAAAVPRGTWATARAAGLVRFGAPPAGQISFLVQGDVAGPDGWARRPGRVIRRLALLAGGAGKVDEASLAALDAARPYNVSAYLDQQSTARELIQSLAASLNCVAGISWTGQLFVVPVGLGPAADVVLAADGSALPPVERVQQLEQAAPYQKLALTAERTWTVHALADIAFNAQLVDLGAYDAGTTYREGNIVQSQGSSWRYLNPTPTAGNAPPALPTTENAYWRVLAKAGTDGKDGSSAYAVIQSNENHIVPAGADGSVITYNGATTTVQVIYNGADVSSSFALTLGDNPQALAATIGGRTVTVTGGLDANEPNALLGLILTGSGSFAGTTLTTSFSLTKSRAGADGSSPPLIDLTASTLTVRYDTAGAFITGQSVAMSVRRVAAPGLMLWSIVDWQGQVIATRSAADFASEGNGFWTSSGADQLTRTATGLAGLLADYGGTIGRLTIRASIDGTSVYDQVTIQRIQDGAVGANAAAISIAATPLTIQYTSTGIVARDIVAAATRQNTSAATLWATYKLDGSVQDAAAPAADFVAKDSNGWSSSGPDQLTRRAAAVDGLVAAGGGGFILEARLAGTAIAQRVTIAKVVDGADAYAVTLSQSAIILRANSDGSIKSGELPRTFGVKVMRGSTDVTGGAAVTFAASDGAIAATYASGVITLTGGTTGWLDTSVSYGSLALGTYRVTITVQRDAPPPSSQTSAAQGFSATAGSSSYDEANATSSLSLKTSTSGQIAVAAYGEYYATGGASAILRIAGKLQYRAASADGWIDAQAEVAGSEATSRRDGDSTPGSITLSTAITGLTANVYYEVRAIFRRNGGTAGGSGAITGDMSAHL